MRKEEAQEEVLESSQLSLPVDQPPLKRALLAEGDEQREAGEGGAQEGEGTDQLVHRSLRPGSGPAVQCHGQVQAGLCLAG